MTNATLANMLRSYCAYCLKQWDIFSSQIEFAYNRLELNNLFDLVPLPRNPGNSKAAENLAKRIQETIIEVRQHIEEVNAIANK